MKSKKSTTGVGELAWLAHVREAGPGLTRQSPIWVRRFEIDSGPAIPHPECHPYCELGIHLSGRGVEYVEREKAARGPGDIFIAGPGVPHWFEVTEYPLTGIAVYFLPGLLCELGPERDGLMLLRRLTSKQGIGQRLVRPGAGLGERLRAGFEEIYEEQEKKQPGHEIRLRVLLMEMLVGLVRAEPMASGWAAGEYDAGSVKWEHVNRALHHLREHFAQRVYARDVAAAAGVSETVLKALFREALGMPWSRYIMGYRIQQAIAILAGSDKNVTEAALMVGFESLSHFNATFRSFMGVSPREYFKGPPKKANS